MVLKITKSKSVLSNATGPTVALCANSTSLFFATPFLNFKALSFVKYFREKGCNSDIVIYTGYYPNELQNEIEQLKQYPNIILKYGRYKPNTPSRFDEVLQITLASDNQYAERIS